MRPRSGGSTERRGGGGNGHRGAELHTPIRNTRFLQREKQTKASHSFSCSASVKFINKIQYVHSLEELEQLIPMEHVQIPDCVSQ